LQQLNDYFLWDVNQMNEIDKIVLDFIEKRDLKDKVYADWLDIELRSFYNRKCRAKKEVGTPFSDKDYALILLKYRNYLRAKLIVARKEKLVQREFSTRGNLCEICLRHEISLKNAAIFMGINYKVLLTKRKQYFKYEELNLLLSNIRNFFEKELNFINNELDNYEKAKKKVKRNKALGRIK